MARIIFGTKDGSRPNIYMAISNKIIRVIEYASRVCYDATDKMTETSWKKYIEARVRSGHESVTEHGLISVVVDFTQWICGASINDFFREKEIEMIEKFVARSNTLLHYVNETGWNTTANDKPIMILSGNVKMWRDFFKWIYRNYPNQIPPTMDYIIKMFVYFDYASCEGIFTSDIPEMQFNNETVKNRAFFDKGETSFFSDTLVDDWNETPILKKESFIPIYIQNPDEEDWSAEQGVRWDMISVDNFGLDFLNVSEIMNLYMNIFIQNHILDLSSVTFNVHTPRIITQQECRHRVNSISQRSQRYVNESEKDTQFYVPRGVNPDKTYGILNNFEMSYSAFNKISIELYKALIKDGVKKEDARCILPGCIYSDMVITKPFYTLPHYFKERCSDAAQKEMRFPAKALRDELNSRFKHTVPTGKTLF